MGISVLLLNDRKNTATLQSMNERCDGKCRKNRELFSLEAKLQWIMF